MAKLVEMGLAGLLPECARWMLGSQLIFLDKKDSDVPRPIRAGEYLRKLIGKSLLNKHAHTIKELMIRMGQFEVAMPGGAEILVHARASNC